MSINIIRLVLASVVIISLFSLVGLAVFFPVQGFQIEVLDAVLGALLAAFAAIVAYVFFRN